MTKKLIIRSLDNEDWNGTWLKGEVEREMREVGNVPSEENDWIYWVLGHVFDCNDFGGAEEKFVAESEAMAKLELRLNDGDVTIEKR